jgi:hypothetical protein
LEEGVGCLKNVQYPNKATTEIMAAVMIKTGTVSIKNALAMATRLPKINPMINDLMVKAFSVIIERRRHHYINISVWLKYSARWKGLVGSIMSTMRPLATHEYQHVFEEYTIMDYYHFYCLANCILPSIGRNLLINEKV